jgi:hypothetical protein
MVVNKTTSMIFTYIEYMKLDDSVQGTHTENGTDGRCLNCCANQARDNRIGVWEFSIRQTTMESLKVDVLLKPVLLRRSNSKREPVMRTTSNWSATLFSGIWSNLLSVNTATATQESATPSNFPNSAGLRRNQQANQAADNMTLTQS